MSKHRKQFCACLGLTLLVVLYPLLHMPNMFPGVALTLVDFVYFAAFGVALMLMDVVRVPESPLSLLPAAILGTALLLYRVPSQMTELTALQWIWTEAASGGVLLLMLSWLLPVYARLRHGTLGAFRLRDSLSHLATVLFACFYPYILTAISDAQRDPLWGAYYLFFFAILIIACGLFLLQFLKKNRFCGIWMAAIGIVSALVYVVVTFTSFARATESAGVIRYVLALWAHQKNLSLIAALIVGGVWCAAPGFSRKKAAA